MDRRRLFRDDAGVWHDFPGFVRVMFGRPVVDPEPEPEPLLALPARVDSDAVTVSLADDATWQHMRALYPAPEVLEGR